MSGDLNVNGGALSMLGDALGRLRGQWESTATLLEPPRGLGGDQPMNETIADFTRTWAKAATAIDTFVVALAGMCHGVAHGFAQTDASLAEAAHGLNHRAF